MMSALPLERCDLAIVGAGPAGMAAAIEACRHGLSAVVLDDQPAAGGQILRGIARPGPVAYEAWGHELLRAFRASGARHVCGAAVWARDGRQLVYGRAGATHRLEARGLILATGSQERPVPVPGNTLPGVVTVGALQSLLKGSACVPAGRFVLAGSGPLLLLCAIQLVQAGARPIAIVDTMPASRRLEALADLPRLALDPALLAKALGLLGRVRFLGVPYHAHAGKLRICGTDRVEALRFEAGGRTHSLAVDLVALHDGVVPNDALAVAMGARTRWNGALSCYELETEGGTRVAGLDDTWAAGDGVAIAGGYQAMLAGRLAGLDAALALCAIPAARHAAQTHKLRRKLARLRQARRFVDRYYAPTLLAADAPDDTLLCRCEEVTIGTIRRRLAEGAAGTRAIKAATRCGMGPCQGRQCTISLAGLLAHEERADMRIERPSGRYPARPITVAELVASDPGRGHTGSDA